MKLDKSIFDQIAGQLKIGLPMSAHEMTQGNFFPIDLVENELTVQSIRTPEEFVTALLARNAPVPIPEVREINESESGKSDSTAG
jgi:hypothetical protein